MSNDRAVVKEYCIEEFGRLVALMSESDAPAERAALELELATVRATFAAAENGADRARRAHAKAHYTRVREFFLIAFDCMAPAQRHALVQRALASGRSLIHECLRGHVVDLTDAEPDS